MPKFYVLEQISCAVTFVRQIEAADEDDALEMDCYVPGEAVGFHLGDAVGDTTEFFALPADPANLPQPFHPEALAGIPSDAPSAPSDAPAPAFKWADGSEGPFTAERDSDDVVTLWDANNRRLFSLNVVTQMPLDDQEGLEAEATEALGLATQIASAMNAFERAPSTAPPAPSDAPASIMRKALEEIAQNGDEEEPEEEDYTDTEEAYANGLDVASYAAAKIARDALAAAGPAPADPVKAEMLAALKAAMDDGFLAGEVLDQVAAAIARAEGRA